MGEARTSQKRLRGVEPLYGLGHESTVYIYEVTTVSAPTTRRASPWQRLIASSAPPRIVGLDIARGVAVFGMIAAHLAELEMSFDWTDISTWTDLVNGRSSILFALLAGISIAVMTGRTARPESQQMPQLRLKMLGRGATIFTIGLLLELLNTGGAIILTFYGILYVIALPFIRSRRRTLLIWSASLALLGPALLVLMQVLTLEPYGSGLGLVFQGVYSLPVWASLMLAGMVIGRMDLTRMRTAAIVFVTGVALAAIGYGAGALYGAHSLSEWEDSKGSWDESWPDDKGDYSTEIVPGDEVDMTGLECEFYEDDWLTCAPEGQLSGMWEDDYSYDDDDWYSDEWSGWDGYLESVEDADLPMRLENAGFGFEPHSGGSAEILGSGGFAMAVVGFFLLTGRWLRWPLIPVAAMGSMPLTAYSVQFVVIFIVGGPMGFVTSNTVFWSLMAGLLIGCTLWVAFLGRGPLERLTKWVGDRMASSEGRN